MIGELLQTIRNRKELLLTVVFMFFISVLVSFSWWDDLQAIALSAFLVVSSYFLISGKIQVNSLSLMDLSWLGFIVLGAMSIFWSTDLSLVWFQLASWSMLIIWSIYIKRLSIPTSFEKIFHLTLAAIFIIVTAENLFGMLTGISYSGEQWQKIYRNNSNYSACYLVSLLPFIWYWDSKQVVYKFINGLFAGSALLLLFRFHASGAIVAFLIIAGIMISNYLRNQDWFKWIYLLPILLVLGGGFLYQYESMFAVGDFTWARQTSRIFFIESSWLSFLKEPLVGWGLGHWHIGVYEYDYSPSYKVAYGYKQFYSHNLYSRLLVELGIIGFLLFFIPFIYTLVQSKFRLLNPFEKACYLNIIVYLVTITFNAIPTFHTYHFSAMELFTFFSVGYLNRNLVSNGIGNISPWFKYLFAILAILGTLWFGYHAKQHNTYYQSLKAEKAGDVDKAIAIMEDVYSPTFKTTHDFTTGLNNKLATFYLKKGDKKKAEENFKKSIELNPSNPMNLFAYANFLKSEQNLEEAKKFALSAHEKHTVNLRFINLLAEIAIEQKDLSLAKEYMEKIRLIAKNHATDGMDRRYINKLEKKLNSSNTQ